jgi:hypothetical protein
MIHRRWWIASWCVLLAGLSPAARAEDPKPKEGADDVRALAAKIDQLLEKAWANSQVTPAAPADDAEFLRRVYLDLAGRIPSVPEVREFLKDTSPDKRRKVVDKLLDSHTYTNHFQNVWRALLLPESANSIQLRIQQGGFDAWLRKQLERNAPYDEMVRELLTVPLQGAGPGRPILALGANTGEPSPIAFYTAKEVKPENLAASTARLFLGVKLECAQCHNHPFADWKRDQFWSFAAFFAGVQRQGNPNFPQPGRELVDKRDLKIPGTEKVVQAAFLDGSKPEWKEKVGGRATLAEWITAADNPYFARAAANRTWGYFFGTGLIDPVDEMVGGENKASHPELLDELAWEFAAHKFDFKFLMRAITASRAYQLTSAASDKSQDDPHQFARMPLRGLTAEQLYDSLAEATWLPKNGPGGGNPLGVIRGGNNPRDQFLAKFGNQSDKVTEAQTSILQALTLMNGGLTGDATHLERSQLLAGVLAAPWMDTNGKIETLYLAALSRMPKAKEMERAKKFMDAALADDDGKPLTEAEKDKRYKQALADVFWALLNSGEFFLNH